MSDNNHQSTETNSSSNNQRRGSFLSSLLSSISTNNINSNHQPNHQNLNNLASSPPDTLNSCESPISSSYSPQINRRQLSQSPPSSLNSSFDSKHVIDLQKSINQPHISHHRRGSITGSLSSLTGFRFQNNQSTIQPIPIPESSPLQSFTNNSVPTRRTSVGGPSFRRAFELPNYSNAFQNDEQLPQTNQEEPKRGRSGSVFGAFGVSYERNQPLNSNNEQKPPKNLRKLSPMGERMIRDQPF